MSTTFTQVLRPKILTLAKEKNLYQQLLEEMAEAILNDTGRRSGIIFFNNIIAPNQLECFIPQFVYIHLFLF